MLHWKGPGPVNEEMWHVSSCFNDQGAMQNGRGRCEREEEHKVRVILTGSPCFLQDWVISQIFPSLNDRTGLHLSSTSQFFLEGLDSCGRPHKTFHKEPGKNSAIPWSFNVLLFRSSAFLYMHLSFMFSFLLHSWSTKHHLSRIVRAK